MSNDHLRSAHHALCGPCGATPAETAGAQLDWQPFDAVCCVCRQARSCTGVTRPWTEMPCQGVHPWDPPAVGLVAEGTTVPAIAQETEHPAVLAEREACAQTAETLQMPANFSPFTASETLVLHLAADAIRARSRQSS